MSNKNNNQINVPQAREAMDRFKMQAAQEVGVNLQNGYNGHLTSREAGSVGGQMVKNNCPVRTLTFHRANRITQGHQIAVHYTARIGV
ncbi:MAG: alpha/beta-type small acid-soluble spore protein [Oscillospiraceae bacterium]|nr:alpha/beta-type small acid-soluble spore protein [Oscillospiraceae bacterium]